MKIETAFLIYIPQRHAIAVEGMNSLFSSQIHLSFSSIPCAEKPKIA
jgi:hypothetical protein